MKKTLIVVPLLFGFSYPDVAEVTKVEPAYKTINVPYQDCRMTKVPVQVIYPGETVSRRAGQGSLLGAVVGGALGSTIGKGDGRTAATVAGAVIGYQAGKENVSTQGQVVTEYREVNQCKTLYRPEVVQDGFVVHYYYNGQRGVTRTDYEPGQFINIRVNIQPE